MKLPHLLLNVFHVILSHLGTFEILVVKNMVGAHCFTNIMFDYMKLLFSTLEKAQEEVPARRRT